MYVYMNSAMAFRGKGSFSLHDFYGSNGRTECVCSSSSSSSWRCPFLIHEFALSHPRILYGLRQSSLIQWPASRRVILGLNCQSGCHQLAAKVVIRDRSWGSRAFFSLKERSIEKRIACTGRRSDRFDLGSDVNIDEMLSLLMDNVGTETVRVRERNRASVVEKARKDSWRCSVCNEKEVRIDECSSREERNQEHNSLDRRFKDDVVIKSVEGHRQGTREDSSSRRRMKNEESDSWDRKLKSELQRKSKGELLIKSRVEGRRREDSSRDDNHELRKETSSSSYYSMSSSGNLEIDVEDKQSKQEKIIGESSGGYNNDSRLERNDVFVEEVKQHGKYESNKQYGGSLSRRNTKMESIKQKDRVISDTMEDNAELDSVKASGRYTVVSGSRESGIQRVSSSEVDSKLRMEDKEELLHGERLQHIEIDQQGIGQKETMKESQMLNRASVMHEGVSEKASSSKAKFNSRIKYREEDAASYVNLAEETSEQHIRTDQQRRGQTESMSQNLDDVSEIHEPDFGRTLSSQINFRKKVNKEKDNANLVLNSVQQAREQQVQTSQQFLAQTESRNQSQKLTNVSIIHDTDTKRVSNSQKVYETGINDHEESSSSVLNQLEEARQQLHQASKQIIRQRGSRKETQKNTIRSEFHGSDVERTSSSSQVLVKTRVKDQAESSISVQNPVQEAGEKQTLESGNSQVMVTPPQSQLVVRGSPACATQGDFNENIVKGGAIESANRLDNSSAQFVGEFVDKLRKEVSSLHELSMTSTHPSEIQKEPTSSAAMSFSPDKKYKQHSSRRFSTGSGAQGPSDEIWDVAGPPSVDLSVTEIPEDPPVTGVVEPIAQANAGNDPVKRSGRSLWSFIPDLFRKGWGARAESHAPTMKSGERSSNESLNSDTWFSGHDPDDDNDENAKKGRRGPLKQSLLTNQTPQVSEKISSGEKMTPVKSDALTSMGMLDRSSAFKSSSVSWKEDFGRVEEQTRKQRIPSGIVAIDSSFPSAGMPSSSTRHIKAITGREEISEIGETRMSRSGFEEAVEEPIRKGTTEVTGVEGKDRELKQWKLQQNKQVPKERFEEWEEAFTGREEISEIGEIWISRSGFEEPVEEPLRKGTTEASGVAGKDRELKQRKLQRNKQVPKEHFEEWEEAFMLEHEQRKTDEMFMREALLEAQKAADSWEVPVGAVLVQNGKIIARGCNLVEDLRDSTAHAEMICIREASNLLRTWRLAETTLYVTLEPCPMCAGAILQARIDTVVWGAPNKLLGADGSWVSLFPGGEEGSNGSDRPPGPVHPFHPKITIRRGILATECSEVMKQFFQLRRKNKKPESPPSRLPVSNHPSKLFSKVHDLFNMMFCL